MEDKKIEDVEVKVIANFIAKFTVFVVKKWHWISLAAILVSGLVTGAVIQWKDMKSIEQHYNKGVMDSVKVKLYDDRVDSIDRILHLHDNKLNRHESRLDKDSNWINVIYWYKQPYSKWGN